MKKYLLIFLLLSTTSFASSFFFEKSVGPWVVLGHPGDKKEELNPACIAKTRWEDASELLIIQDLTNGELHLEFKNNEWDISDEFGKQYELTLNVYAKNNSSVKSWQVYFILVNKNSINIRGLDQKSFLNAFMNFATMKFIMPGNIPNAVVDLKNTTKVIDLMTDCLKVAEKGIPTESNSLNPKLDM